MDDLTIVYYTSNSERPAFEENVRKVLVKMSGGNVPIVSVSQKPIEFGTNICVGDVGRSGHNIFRQMLIGCKAATTKYVCTAESDVLYPPEYFQFRPAKDDVAYFASPLYVCWSLARTKKKFSLKPNGSESAMVANRECLLSALERMMEPWGMWNPDDSNGRAFWWLTGDREYCKVKRDYFTLPNPVVTFKTDQGLHRVTPHDANSSALELPFWGDCHELIRRMRTDGY
jgi:hypothetical protein